MRRATALALIGTVGLAGLALPAGSASAAVTDEIVLSKLDSTVESAGVLCNGDPSDTGVSTAQYEVTLSGLTRTQLNGLRASMANPSATSGLHMGWQHLILEMGDATGAISSTVTVYINDRRVGSQREADSGEQDTSFVFTPTLWGLPRLLKNGDVIRVEVEADASAECNGGTGTGDQAIAQASTATYDGHTAHIDYSY